MNGSNDVAVSLGRYKDKTIAELVDAITQIIEMVAYLPRDANVGGETSHLLSSIEAYAHTALARARTDPSWQRYSRDNQEPLDLAE